LEINGFHNWLGLSNEIAKKGTKKKDEKFAVTAETEH